MTTELTHERLKQLVSYDPETGVFTWLQIRGRIPPASIAGTHSKGYWRLKLDSKGYPAHRVAWFYMTGQWPKHVIDHINGICDDNRFSNLREATIAQNTHNMRPKNTPGHLKGASYLKRDGLWQSHVHVNGKHISLGRFKTQAEAHAAYCAAAKLSYGDFARTTAPVREVEAPKRERPRGTTFRIELKDGSRDFLIQAETRIQAIYAALDEIKRGGRDMSLRLLRDELIKSARMVLPEAAP